MEDQNEARTAGLGGGDDALAQLNDQLRAAGLHPSQAPLVPSPFTANRLPDDFPIYQPANRYRDGAVGDANSEQAREVLYSLAVHRAVEGEHPTRTTRSSIKIDHPDGTYTHFTFAQRPMTWDEVAREDTMLAQKLLLETDEDAAFTVANYSNHFPGMYG